MIILKLLIFEGDRKIRRKKNRKKTEKTFKSKKLSSFKNFAETINLNSSSQHVWNTCKIFENKWVKINQHHMPEYLQTEIKN